MPDATIQDARAPSAPETYFSAVLAAFERAAAGAGEEESFYRFGPWTGRLRIAGPALAPALIPALAHLRCDPAAPADLTICCWDTLSTATPIPPPPWTRDAYGQRGEILGYNDDRFGTMYLVGAGIFTMVDRQRRLALYWTAKAEDIPYWERSFPFRVILHWTMAELPLQPLHAGAVGRPEGGVLLTGKSGSGKSTTATSCLRSPLRYAGDDYVLVGTEPEPYVYSLYNSTKLVDRSLELFPDFARYVWNPVRGPDEKAMIFVHAHFPERMIAGFPIRAILVPRVTGLVDTTMREISPGRAMLALAPSTIAHLQGNGPETLRKLAQLSQRVPSYEIAVGTDLRQIPEAIGALLDRIAPR